MLKKIQQRGFLYLVGMAFNRVVPPWLVRYRVFDVFELQISQTERESVASHDNRPEAKAAITLAAGGTVDQMKEIQAISEYVIPAGEEDRRSAYRACVDDKLAGVVWFATESFQESDLGVRIALQPDQVWLFAAQVSPWFRNQGIYSRLVRFAMHDQTQSGNRAVFAAINPHNRVSMKAHRKLMRRTVGRVRVLRILNAVVCSSRGSGICVKPCCSSNASGRPLAIALK